MPPQQNGRERDLERSDRPKNGVNPRRDSIVSDITEDESIADFIPEPPDGGWGWVIVAASLVSNVIVDGIGYSFGVFLPEFVRTFGASRSKVSLIGSLLCGTYLCAGPIVSALTNKFGCRPVAMVGSVIATIAFVLATFSPSIEILILTYGVLGGVGFGMIYLPSIVSVGYYFEKRRAMATGIAVCGSGIGTFIFAPFTKFLLDTYDWKNALLIMAGIIFNGAVCGALMRPLMPAKRKKPEPKPARAKNVLDRIKEEAKRKRKRNFTSESSGIGTTDTTEILEKVRQAKMQRENYLQDNESDICSLPSAYFEKDRMFLRQDSRTSGARSRLQKLSFSERGDASSPVSTPKITVDGNEMDSVSFSKDGDMSENASERDPSSSAASPVRSKSPDTDRPSSPNKHRVSQSSTGSTGKLNLPKGVVGHEVQPLIKVGHGGVQSRPNVAKELMARSGAAAGSSRPHLFASNRSISSKDYSRPMYKKDIFYSGSIVNINEFKSQPSMHSYITSITSIPGDLGIVDVRTETCLHRVCSCLPKPVVDVLSEMMDVSLLTNPGFMCICLGNIFAMIGFYVPYVYIVDRALLTGIDMTQASFLLSVIGITNTIGRVLSGIIADLRNVSSLMLNNVCMLIAGIAIFLTPFCSSYALLIVAASVFGLMTAAFISLTSIVLCDLLGLGKLTNAFGLLSMGRGIAGIVGPPFAGEVFRMTGNYDASFFLGGGLFLVGTLLHFALFLPCFKKKDESEFEVPPPPETHELDVVKEEPERPIRVEL